MNCSQCGEVCRCHPEPPPADSHLVAEAEDSSSASSPVPEKDSANSSAWRDELSARLTRYRSRRRVPPPRYPSLNLLFTPAPGDPPASAPTFRPASDRTLALNELTPDSVPVEDGTIPGADPPPSSDGAQSPGAQSLPSASQSAGARIIEFPRSAWAPPAPPSDQLAEPVFDQPRILDVPEIVPPAPALGGITIESEAPLELEKRPGIDAPLETASLARRIAAGTVDAAIIAAAAALFAEIFWKVAAVRPSPLQLLGLAVGVPAALWASYHYLLIVYSASTPGLRLAGLALARFDGAPPTRSLRRWRMLASYLSAAALGMGYVWVLLDEDALCWHDRITRTHLAARSREHQAPGARLPKCTSRFLPSVGMTTGSCDVRR